MNWYSWAQNPKVVALLAVFAIVGGLMGGISLALAIEGGDFARHQATVQQSYEKAMSRVTMSNAQGMPAGVYQVGDWSFVELVPTVGLSIKVDMTATCRVIRGQPH